MKGITTNMEEVSDEIDCVIFSVGVRTVTVLSIKSN